MYCKSCGRYIDYDSPLCQECEEAEAAKKAANAEIEAMCQQTVTPAQEPEKTTDESVDVPKGMAFRPTHTSVNPYLSAQSTIEGSYVPPIKEADIATAEDPVPADINEEYKEPETGNESEAEREKPKGNKMHGFGPALTGVILGIVATIIDSVTGYVTGVSSFLTLLADLSGNSDMGNNITAGGMLVNILIGVVCLVIGIVTLCLGAKSVKAFKAHKNETGTKAIATLILGIAGIVIGAYGIIGFIDNIVTMFVYLGMGLLSSAMG